MPDPETASPFAKPTWAIVEIMGHQVIAGQLSEVTVAGAAMLRVDVPALPATPHRAATQPFTRFYGAGAIYAITPVDEFTALQAVAHYTRAPIDAYTIRHMLADPVLAHEEGPEGEW